MFLDGVYMTPIVFPDRCRAFFTRVRTNNKGFFFRDPHILIRLDVGARVAIRSYPRHLQVSLNVLRERKTWSDRAR
jgi:hypothetical protein